MKNLTQMIDEKFDLIINEINQTNQDNGIVQNKIEDIISSAKLYLNCSLYYNNIYLFSYFIINLLSKLPTLDNATTITFNQDIMNEINDVKMEKEDLLQLKNQLSNTSKNEDYNSLYLIIITSLVCIKSLRKIRDNRLNQFLTQYTCMIKHITYEPINEREEMNALKLKVKESLSQLKNNHVK